MLLNQDILQGSQSLLNTSRQVGDYSILNGANKLIDTHTMTSVTRDVNNSSPTMKQLKKQLDKGAHNSSPLAKFLTGKNQITTPRRYKPMA